MQTITAQLDSAFRSAIGAAFDLDADPQIALSVDGRFGDYQSNAAMGLAREVAAKTGQKTNPRAVAERIKEKLRLDDMAAEVTIAGPGFINVRLSKDWLEARLREVAGDARLGVEPVREPQVVVVDYSGPNIAKEMHVGHIRSTIIGDAVARLIDFQGHTVKRQNHIGDWGTQFGMLIEFLKSWPEKLPHETTSPSGARVQFDVSPTEFPISDLESFYRNAKALFDSKPAFADQARKAVVALQGGNQLEIDLWKHIVRESRKHFEAIYHRLGVKLTEKDERSESSYNSMLADVVKDLRAKNIATDSEGAIVCFVEGHENPLIIEKTGGGYLYGTTDLAAVRYRVRDLHAQRVLYFVDARQSQHFALVFAVARKAGWADGVSLEHAAFGTILGDDGKPFKTRSGEIVKLKDLLDEAEERAFALVTQKNPEAPETLRKNIARAVGIGGVKYADLSKDRTSDYVFSWDKMLAMDGNTGPYLQYAHARICSIFRKAGSAGGSPAVSTSIQLGSPHELALGKHLLRFGEIIELVGRELKPHHLCTYLYELASRFSGFYENCPVLQSEEPLRSSRLALCDLTRRTMAIGLDLLGIEHPEQM
jgi:arginyl-tRNA synthetase